MSAQTDAGAAPGRFAPRLGALLLDLGVALIALQLIAPPAYVASGGQVQLLNAPYGVWRCEGVSGAASEVARAMGPQICRRTLFGHPFASAVTEGAGASATRREAGPIDAAGRPVSPFDLGWLLAPLFVAVRLWFEGFGMRSPGRALFGQRLVAQDGEAADGAALLRRYGALVGPFLLCAWCAATAIRFAPTLAAGATALAALAIVASYGAASVAILRGRAPFHDRAARTRVLAAAAPVTGSTR